MAVLTSPSESPSRKARPPLAIRRFGYLVAVLVNALILYAVNRWPGWDALPFLTEDTEQVIPWVNASIVVGLAVNALYLVRDPQWFRSLGDMVTTAISVVVLVRLWDVFPLDVSEGWEVVARILLGVALVGTAIGFVAALVTFVRSLGDR